jgi:hypothetical protein
MQKIISLLRSTIQNKHTKYHLGRWNKDINPDAKKNKHPNLKKNKKIKYILFPHKFQLICGKLIL